MNVEITHISVHRAAKVSAIMSSFFVLPIGLVMALGVLLQVSSKDSWWLAPPIALLPTALMLLIAFVISSSMGAFVAVVYNFVASRWGGLEISMVETGRR